MDTNRCGSGGRCWTVRSGTRSGRGGSGGLRRHRLESPEPSVASSPLASRSSRRISFDGAWAAVACKARQQKPGEATVKKGRRMPGQLDRVQWQSSVSGAKPAGQDASAAELPETAADVEPVHWRHLRWLTGRHPRQRKQRSCHPGSREVGLG